MTSELLEVSKIQSPEMKPVMSLKRDTQKNMLPVTLLLFLNSNNNMPRRSIDRNIKIFQIVLSASDQFYVFNFVVIQ